MLGGRFCTFWAWEADNKIGIGKTVSCEDEQRTALTQTPGLASCIHSPSPTSMQQHSQVFLGQLEHKNPDITTILLLMKDLKESQAHFA